MLLPQKNRGLTILYQDNHLLAVDKPACMLTAGDRTRDPSLLDIAKQYLKQQYGKPGNVYLGLVHRLDRPVSGVVLFARTSKAARRLSDQFRTGTVRKLYHAWVHGRPERSSAELVDFLLKDCKNNIVRVVGEGLEGARRAALEYSVLDQAEHRSLLEIRPHSGRAHQIRVQLASRGLPILGDVKYGGPRWRHGCIALHASELTLDHPVGQQTVTIRAAEPKLWESF